MVASWKIRLVTLTAIPVLACCNRAPSTPPDQAAREACQKFRDLIEATESTNIPESEEYHSRVEDIRNTGRESQVESLSEAASRLETREGMTIEEAQERFADFEKECDSLRL